MFAYKQLSRASHAFTLKIASTIAAKPQNLPQKTTLKTMLSATHLAPDPLDRRILALYQHDTRQPAQDIGEKVGLSAAAVQRRIKRMRETGVIQADIAHLDPAALGLAVTVIVHVDIDQETLPHIDAFKAAMRGQPAVQQCWYTTGLTDFVLVVRVPSLAAYEAFTRQALLGLENVARFTSYVVLDEVKSGLALDMGPAAVSPSARKGF